MDGPVPSSYNHSCIHLCMGVTSKFTAAMYHVSIDPVLSPQEPGDCTTASGLMHPTHCQNLSWLVGKFDNEILFLQICSAIDAIAVSNVTSSMMYL